jgi:hypothetical protein
MRKSESANVQICKSANLQMCKCANRQIGKSAEGTEGAGDIHGRWANVDGGRRLFLINRALIVLAVAAILAGLFFDQWYIVLRNAILL